MKISSRHIAGIAIVIAVVLLLVYLLISNTNTTSSSVSTTQSFGTIVSDKRLLNNVYIIESLQFKADILKDPWFVAVNSRATVPISEPTGKTSVFGR